MNKGLAFMTDLKLPPVDLYDLLGTSREANHDEIIRAYRRIAKKTHPDRKYNNLSQAKKMEEIFRLATLAYDILSNPRKRAQYDRMTKPSFITKLLPWINNSERKTSWVA